MSDLGRQAHWQSVYMIKDEKVVSWFQERPDISIDLIRATGVDVSASIIDIGGGASRLVDALIDDGFKTVTVLDLSDKALATSKAGLGARGGWPFRSRLGRLGCSGSPGQLANGTRSEPAGFLWCLLNMVT